MVIAGLLVAVFGFVISLSSLGLASGAGARLAMVLTGIAVSLAGILGLVNRAYLRNVIWKK
jgi:hypothetical protein